MAIALQERVCERLRAPFDPPGAGQRVGASEWFLSRPDQLPIHGLRIPPHGEVCGWYLWAGEAMREDPDYFRPLHVEHLIAVQPIVVPYLALPPGWRFVLAPGYEDVWYDPALLSPRP